MDSETEARLIRDFIETHDPEDHIERIMVEGAKRHLARTKGEAGRHEGHVGPPDLVVGDQRYPDPRVWGPDIETPLTLDERYGRAAKLVERLDALTGFDGRQL